MESCLTSLEGSRTHARYDADVLQRLDPVDGAPLLPRYDLARVARTMTPRSLAERHGPGMWRWRELLPVRDARNIIHLGEGSTPLLPARRLGPALGVDELLVKAEGQNPTGSFKARGMAAAVSRARELGARSLIAPSAGNAGGALAAYGAAAGMPVTVVVPSDTPEANIVESQICGAEVVLVNGLISDCAAVAAAIAARTGAFDVSTMKEPYRVEGKKTMGLELVEQLGWAVPDVIVYPTGGGTGLIGMWKAFDELEALGLLGTGRPRLVSVQAEGCAPIVRAFEDGAESATFWENAETRASGLRVPSAVADFLILSAVRESEGTAVAVPEGEIDAVQRLAGTRGAGYVSPESAAAFAAVALLADAGWLAANERVVVFDTGIGQKYPPPELPHPPVVDPDVVSDPERMARLLPSAMGPTLAAREVGSGNGDAAPTEVRRTPGSIRLASLMAQRAARRATNRPPSPHLAPTSHEEPEPAEVPAPAGLHWAAEPSDEAMPSAAEEVEAPPTEPTLSAPTAAPGIHAEAWADAPPEPAAEPALPPEAAPLPEALEPSPPPEEPAPPPVATPVEPPAPPTPPAAPEAPAAEPVPQPESQPEPEPEPIPEALQAETPRLRLPAPPHRDIVVKPLPVPPRRG